MYLFYIKFSKNKMMNKECACGVFLLFFNHEGAVNLIIYTVIIVQYNTTPDT